MKFRKRLEFVELPEKSGNDYLNVRSAVRIDIRPGETLDVDTGLDYMVSNNDPSRWSIAGDFNVFEAELTSGGYKPLYIKVRNMGNRNIMIYVGEPIARVVGTTKPVEKKAARKPTKKTTFTSEFELDDAN